MCALGYGQMMPQRVDVLSAVKRGADACRRGDWTRGLAVLSDAASANSYGEELPGYFYSFYGYAIARFEGRRREGLELCRHSIKLEFYRGENYLNLARTYLLTDHRAAAVKVINQGLAVDPKNRELRKLLRELGLRRQPILPFLHRAHPVNRFLGRLRHRLFG